MPLIEFFDHSFEDSGPPPDYISDISQQFLASALANCTHYLMTSTVQVDLALRSMSGIKPRT